MVETRIKPYLQAIDEADRRAVQRIRLDTAAHRFRYYLVWITKLPPGRASAELSDVTLFK